MSDVVHLQKSTAAAIVKIQRERLTAKGIKDSKSRIVAEAVAQLAKKDLHE